MSAKEKSNLWVAASDGDIERVQYLIKNEGFTPNSKDEYGYTPMHAASAYAHFDMLEWLVENGGDVNVGMESDNFTACSYCMPIINVMHHCILKRKRNERFMSLLHHMRTGLNSHADQGYIYSYLWKCRPANSGDSDGDTPLMHCEDTRAAEWLLEHGAKVDQTNNDGVNVVQRMLTEMVEANAEGKPVSVCLAQGRLA